MTKVNWLLDECLEERNYNTGFPTLSEAALQLGHNVLTTKYIPFTSGVGFKSHYDYELNGKKVKNIDDILYNPNSWQACNNGTVVHGTIEFCKLFEREVGRYYTPGLYFNKTVKHFTHFSHHMGDDLLNSDYYILPYGEFVNRKLTNVFIKPESGLKEFVGQVFDGDYQKLSPFGEIDPNTLVVVSETKEIKAEFRYVICGGKVITGSEYRWDNKLDVRIDTHPICDMLVNKIATAEWQADRVYVCDIALLDNDVAKVIELNAFSSSGLYACDTLKIVEAVSEEALKENEGID